MIISLNDRNNKHKSAYKFESWWTNLKNCLPFGGEENYLENPDLEAFYSQS